MDSLKNSVSENSSVLVNACISIVLLKGADFAGRSLGNFLRSKFVSRRQRYSFFLILVIVLLVASSLYYRNEYPPNLFRKYELTRFTPPDKIRELYRSLARQSHPDMQGKKSDFVSMNAELKALMNDRQRWFYDRFGKLPSTADPDEEQTEQISFAMGTFMEYLGKGMFAIAFVDNDLNLNTRMSALGLVLLFLLFDIYNITARSSSAKDPLDFIYYDFTIAERSEILKTTFNLFYFFLITYKFAFQQPWIMNWLAWIGHTEVLQLELARRSPAIQQHLHDQHSDLVAYRSEIIQCMHLVLNKKKPKQTGREQTLSNGQGQTGSDTLHQHGVNGSSRDLSRDDLRQGRLFPMPADSESGPAGIGVTEKEEEEEVQDPRDTNLWSLVWGIIKGIASFYAFNMLIQYLADL